QASHARYQRLNLARVPGREEKAGGTTAPLLRCAVPCIAIFLLQSAQSQGAVDGRAHSGLGLQVQARDVPSFQTRISGATDFPRMYDSRVGVRRSCAQIDRGLTFEG